MDFLLDDCFIKNCPSLDLHGENKDVVRMLVNDFIQDNHLLKNNKIIVIHGIGTGALKDEVSKVLKENKLVKEFHLNHYNSGCTVVYLKK